MLMHQPLDGKRVLVYTESGGLWHWAIRDKGLVQLIWVVIASCTAGCRRVGLITRAADGCGNGIPLAHASQLPFRAYRTLDSRK